MSFKKEAYANLAETIIDKFAKRGIEGYYVESSDEAVEIASRFFTPGCTISYGGSETIKEIGLIDIIKATADYNVIDRLQAKTEEEKMKVYADTVCSDFFLMSSNAITLDGELVNIDGNGNRVACLITGPKNVIVIAGMNKITTDVKSAIDRVRNFAAPPNAVRLHTETPCEEYGRCMNCLNENCMCCHMVVTRKSRINGRIKVILVGEELGY